MRKYRIAFCQFPGSGSSRMETNAWVVRTVREMDRDDRIESVISLTYSDVPITMTRNRAVLEARAAKADFALFLDSDMAPDAPYAGSRPFWASSWEFMLERRDREFSWGLSAINDKHKGGDVADLSNTYFPPATIAAPYCGPSPDQCCYVFDWKSRGSGHPNPDFQLGMIPRESAAVRSGIQEVAALPTGLILYDLRVFDVLPPPWYAYEWGDPPYDSVKVTTEDVYQTRNASLLGLPQFCNWDSWALHVKTERVGKPTLVTRDQVHASLRDAVLRGLDGDDRLVVVKGDSSSDSEEALS